VNDIEELKRQGLSVQAISRLTGFDRKTIRKYLLKPEGTPVYGPRAARPSKLDAFQPYIEERLKAGVWNAKVLLRELRV
jgi:transposase